MNNCDTDISGDCPAKHLVRSNLKIGTERLVRTGSENAVALAWSANAAMPGRIEEYSTPEAATRWRLRFGAVPCEQLRTDF